MFNKAERARREEAARYHRRSWEIITAGPVDRSTIDQLNATARFHRKQAELWEKHVKAFDRDALQMAKLVGRRS